MKKAAAIAHFGTVVRVAEALGITKGAVSQWGEIVPLESAVALEIASGRALKIDRTKYPGLVRALDSAEATASQQDSAA